ncbi:MAG: hypothetical protein AAF399_29890, partial [Bacteroidota bacterium]
MVKRALIQLSTQALDKLFRINCLHEYYGDQVCRDLELVPSPETETELKNCRLTFKNLPGGGIVFYHKTQSTPILKSPAFRPRKLTFLLKNTNKNFLHFSDLPYLPEGAIYYLNNLGKPPKKGAFQALHEGPYLHADPAKPMYVMPTIFDLSFAKEVAYKDIVVVDAWGNQVELPDLSIERSAIKRHLHPIDLSDHPEGRYQIKAKGIKEVVLDAYVGGPTLEGAFGIVDLFFTSEVEKANQIANDQEIQYRELEVRINTRSTYWRYYLINRTDAIFSDQSITNQDKKLKFSKPEEIQLRN